MDKTYLGRRLAEFSPGIASQPITKVELLDENGDVVGVSGSDTGRTLTALNPDGTDAMAAAILKKVSGYKHIGYEGSSALLDPAVELGDAVTVDGHYVPLIALDMTFDPLLAPDISAPDADEIDDEYPYKSPTQRQIERNMAKARSLITKTSEEIMLKVEGIDGRVTSLSTSIDGIKTEVSGKIDGNTAQSMINQTVNSITFDVSSGSNGSTFTLKAGSAILSTETLDLHVKSANIDGTLTAGILRGNQIALINGSGDTIGGMLLSDTTTGNGLGFTTTLGGIQLRPAGNIFLQAGTGGDITIQSGLVQLGSAALCLATASFGTSAPSGAGVAGQLYIQLVS